MTGLALSLLLVVPTSELTPPPLVVAPPPVPEPSFEEPARPPLAPPLQTEEGAENDGNPAQRVFLTALTGAAASAATFGVSIWLSKQLSKGNTASEALFDVLSVPMTLLVASAVAMGVHRKLDGEGSFGANIGGMSIGAGLGLAVWALATNFRFSTDTTTAIGVGTATALLAGLGAALMAELSHWRWWNEHHPQVAVLPSKGGATASLGWSF